MNTMPRKKDSVKGKICVPRTRENSRLMHAHESVVDFIKGRPSAGSFLDVFTSDIFGLNFSILRNLDEDLENDLIYSYDNDEDEDLYSSNDAQMPLAPHPRIKQLTDEEAEHYSKQLEEEEERCKDKSEKNKRKKLRKKEKKRLEKENAAKENFPEEEPGKCDSSDSGRKSRKKTGQKENPNAESDLETNESVSPPPAETQNQTGINKCDSNEDKNDMKTHKEKKPKDFELNNSYVLAAAPAAKESPDQTQTAERKEDKNKLFEVMQPEEKSKDPEVQKKTEEKNNTFKEKTMDASMEECLKISGKLASIGNRLAASGQFEMAAKCFTDAIKYNPKEYKLFGNRSLCYERMEQHENALLDADVALSIEPNWIKGLFRKGKALCGLKKYYEASLIYKEVLKLDSLSAEASQELKRVQMLHLMEMGFSWADSMEALKTHASLEEACEALFGNQRDACGDVNQPMEDDDKKGEWILQQAGRSRTQQIKESGVASQSRPKSQSPTPTHRNSLKPELFPVWVGSLAPSVTYATMHELFSRVGKVYSIKMLLEHQCAFVNYVRKEECDRAIQCFNGMLLEGAPLLVRYPNRIHTGLGTSKSALTDSNTRSFSGSGLYKKECFFWRTTGCTRQDCTYRHVPEHKNIDKEKFTSRLTGNYYWDEN
ncbi:hypothetical protein LDENG_00116830 [Lucifuga dentata]|nr:hypothetical protein LDENG_00116830 [Lucifuga dentata]